MENCLYHEKIICTFDLKDNNGLYYEDLVLEWKEAAANRQLFCMECGEPVYLAAGPIKEPYFAHYDGKECEYGNGHESEQRKKGKRLLYQLFKRSFPDSSIMARYRMDNGLYSTIYCQIDPDHTIAVDYRLQNDSLTKFQIRDGYYQVKSIKPLYILGINQYQGNKQFSWYQNLIQKSMGFCVFLDTDKENMVLIKSFGYRLGNVRKFTYCKGSYLIKELKIDRNGDFLCEFAEACKKTEDLIHKEKDSYLQQEEQQRKLRENIRLQAQKDELEQARYRMFRMETEERWQEENKKFKYIEAKKDQEVSQIQESNNKLDPFLLEKCKKMIEEGNAHLVSQKYLQAILSQQE